MVYCGKLCIVQCSQAGVQKAVQPGAKESMKARRVPIVREPLLVTGSGGAFVSYVPGST